MNQAFLLWARNGVVRRVEVSDEHTAESVQHLVKKLTFSRRSIHVSNVEKAGENPNVTGFRNEFHLRFVGMYEAACHQLLDDLLVGAFVVSRCKVLQLMNLRER